MTAEELSPRQERGVLGRVLGNAGTLLGGRTINAVLSLAYLALAARSLGVTAFGVLSLIHAFSQFLFDVAKFQSWQTVIHYGSAPLAEGRKREFQQVVRLTLVLDTISCAVGVLVGVAGAFLLANTIGWGREHAPAAALYAFTIVFMVSATPTGVLRLLDRFDILAHQTALVALVRLIGTAVAFVLKAPVEAFLAAWALGTVAGFVYLTSNTLLQMRKRGLLEGFTLRGPLGAGLPGIWRFSWATNASTLLESAFAHFVTLVVGAMVGPAEAGFWRIGRQVADAIAKPAKLIVPALYPELVKLKTGRIAGSMGKLALQIALIAGGFSLVLLAISAFAGGPLLSLVMGREFAPAAGLMTWQVAAAALALFALPLEPMLISLGRPGAAVKVRLVVGIAFLAFLPWITHRLGAQGAAMALVCAAGALAIGMLGALLRGGARPASIPTEPAEAAR